MTDNVVLLNSRLSHLTPVPPVTDWERVLGDWLATKRSPHTRRVYQKDIENFLADLNLELGKFLSLDRHKAFELVSRYKGELVTKGLKSATINRRLAAIKSLVCFAYNCGHCEFMLEAVKGEKLSSYRDTTGVDCETFKRVLGGIDRETLKGIRDYALLMLLWSNALRRSEVSKANINDFDPVAKTLRIFGKGKGHNAETVSLGSGTVTAIMAWLEARGETNPDKALFVSVNPGYRDGRLSTQSIYNIVSDRCQDAGITKTMSPHRIRHSSITAALEATGGDVRRVQKLSRHSSLNTLLIYDDNRKNLQGQITDLLDSLI
ncbi:MAG: tyrosine-type recombinase/integrase [Microcystis sp. M54BS1]|uniref:tyrosine-type recombinase/integrase n=1 Tax=unclassified Microcystis TaxID=2643300 RepID=UPI0025808375|nr:MULTISPECIES: tyrosine-type recombinase/integrase [unclassified Microcystis]MCA2538889.1 tyrosine-type recombinase/integrase [Microcystis sp. M54BS1]MCA2596533.1 tyrosine-type recombinase/integrase [Microcystis sp. M38BS1]MCA2611990.1 tyrosine-type recombinase/integrase [Microcystis sp. M27BS1]MCA2504764.1 tyrosine-type recombinase/integrase [Microcystis sp. M62BS1]MCA2511015.1 tyrosine-type recombinase/integrase [Microcystis sp. M60BS1]